MIKLDSMKTAHRIQIFNDRYPLIGPVFWMLSVQYYLTQLVVAWAWSRHYSLRYNTISDLGNTICGGYGSRYVCSPGHAWMNASFIVLGATMIAGSGLIYHEFPKSRLSRLGFSLMAIAGLGTILVGAFPENSLPMMHILGASLPFLLGNLALIILGATLKLPRTLKVYTLASGLIAVLALPLFATHTYLGLGIGGMERIVAYPQSLWLIAFGVYMSHSHFARRQALRQRAS